MPRHRSWLQDWFSCVGALTPCTIDISVQPAHQRLSWVGFSCHHPCFTDRLARVYSVKHLSFPCFKTMETPALAEKCIKQTKCISKRSWYWLVVSLPLWIESLGWQWLAIHASGQSNTFLVSQHPILTQKGDSNFVYVVLIICLSLMQLGSMYVSFPSH